MKKYNVVLSPTAQRDLLSVFEYTNTLSSEVAPQYIDQLFYEAGILETSPETCPFTRDAQLRLRGYRVLAVKDYYFFFVINGSSGNKVEIRRILYSSRHYEQLV